MFVKISLILFFFHISFAHICLIHPPQRGGYDISQPGSYSCFQPQAPCGTVPPSQPTITLTGGRTFYILFQQNLNHYNPGYPGFLDVGFSIGTNQTSDSDFISLTKIPDYWPHFQATQTNFSVPIVIPDIDCDWCTLQVRYHPNKPTEPIFHQCADIKIAQSTTPLAKGNFIGISKAGPSYSNFDRYSKFVDIDAYLGHITEEFGFNSHITQRGIPQSEFNVATGLVTGGSTGGITFLGSNVDDILYNEAFSNLYQLSITGMSNIFIEFPETIVQWDGILTTYNNNVAPYILIGQQEDSNSGIYTYSAFWLYENGTISSPIATTAPDMTYVNYFWADYNPCAGSGGQIYILAGDENSLVSLNVKLFTIDIATNTASNVLVDNSEYTITSIHAWASGDCSNVYSISSGIVAQYPSNRTWSLITVNPVTGAITNPIDISEPGEYTQYYGGAVYGQGVTMDNQIPHIFKRQFDDSYDIKLINVQTGEVDSSTALNLGVNTQLYLSSVVYRPQVN